MPSEARPLRTRALAALQDTVRSLLQPLHEEQAAHRQQTDRLMRDALGRIERVESRIRDLTESVLFTRWAADADALYARNEAGHWLNWLGLGGEGVEVGVFQGEFSSVLLRTWMGERLSSVDPWRAFSPSSYVDSCNATQSQHDSNHAQTIAKLATFADRSRIMRLTSVEAAERFSNGSLDFVYIDAQHHYEAVREDIALWHPKLKAGGVMGGHDYLDGQRQSGIYGVKKAVDEFAQAAGYKVIVTREPNWPSWFLKIA